MGTPAEHADRPSAPRPTGRIRGALGTPARRLRELGLMGVLGLDSAMLIHALKLAISAGSAWALAVWITGAPAPIWAPITASLITLLNVGASIRDAAQKVLAVIMGVGIAIWLGGLIDLNVWSVAVIVAVGYLVGKVFRMNPAATAQIPITGLFLLAVGNSEAQQRFLDTIIGAAVAVVVNFVVVPPNHTRSARRAVIALTRRVLTMVSTMADGISDRWRTEQAEEWLRSARGQRRPARVAESEIAEAESALLLHPRRWAWRGPLERVRRAADTLLMVDLQVRVIARTLLDTARKAASEDGWQQPMPVASHLLHTTANTILVCADTMLAYEKDAHPMSRALYETAGSGASSAPDGMPTATGSALTADGETPPHRIDAAEAAIAQARALVDEINAALPELMRTNPTRGVFVGALAVETERILDELTLGLVGNRERKPR